MPTRSLVSFVLSLLLATVAVAEPPPFRTDDNPDKSLPWFRLVEGEFPPENSAHAISGELIEVDHLERRFRIRVDRDDTQDAGHLDLPLEAAMLPYGSIYYHGAPAALQDIPLGTHLHGLFYLKDPDDKSPRPAGRYGRMTREVDFNRCFQLEDDFSFHARQGKAWKILDVDLEAKTLTAVLQLEDGSTGADDAANARTFNLLSSTKVREGRGFADLESLKAGQITQFNLTWATLYGPGRILEIWIDQPSRELATAHQLERHRTHIRERGLPGWVTAVDDDAEIVTITFFGGVDPKLFEELSHVDEKPHGWPFTSREKDPLAPKGGICVARECLMTYDPVNDRKGGNILEIRSIPIEPGGSGVQIDVECCLLLEGFRPKRVVRFYPATWKVDALPREEQYHGQE